MDKKQQIKNQIAALQKELQQIQETEDNSPEVQRIRKIVQDEVKKELGKQKKVDDWIKDIIEKGKEKKWPIYPKYPDYYPYWIDYNDSITYQKYKITC